MNENAVFITANSDTPLSEESKARLAALDDRPIDYSDIPPLSDEWLAEAAAQRKARTKKPVSIRLDEDIIEFFKKEDVHYQSRINAVLRGYVDAMRA